MDKVTAVKSEKDMSSKYKTSALRKTKELLSTCVKQPIPPEQFTEIAMATFSNGYSMEPEKLLIKKGRNLDRKEQVAQ